MLALSIRQPFAELILRGVKTVEYRTINTRIVGRRFHIYAPLKKATADTKVWSRDLAMPGDRLPAWLIELAEQVKWIERELQAAGPPPLPRGVIVGSAVIDGVSRLDGMYAWHLTGVERATTLLKPGRRPGQVWF
jgi:hypothetical protein